MTTPDPLTEALRRQFDRADASMRVDRKGWTDKQWITDADRLMNEVDGAITSLVNGHVMALLAEYERLRGQVDRVRGIVDAADSHGKREPYYAWVRSSDLRAALDTPEGET